MSGVGLGPVTHLADIDAATQPRSDAATQRRSDAQRTQRRSDAATQRDAATQATQRRRRRRSLKFQIAKAGASSAANSFHTRKQRRAQAAGARKGGVHRAQQPAAAQCPAPNSPATS